MIDIEFIKSANPIEEVIEETGYTLAGNGRYLKARAHDSLVIDTNKQYYVWNAKGESGDVITWLENEQGMSFQAAVEHLARRAGIPIAQFGRQDMAAFNAQRERYDTLTTIANYLRTRLTPAAIDYATRRGWTQETITEAALGFWDGDNDALLTYLAQRSIANDRPEVVAVTG